MTSLLGLIGVEADPVKSREHILLSTLLDTAWRAGRDLDLAALIQQIQSPPMTRVGVFDLESFYPAKERFGLAMALNNLLASPGFDTWMTGEPLDVAAAALHRRGQAAHRRSSRSRTSATPSGCSSSRCCSTRWSAGCARRRARRACGRSSTWTRSPATSRRWPNPPSKPPLLTLLKQARAFGLGVVLATQNPVDLDYKGLSNAGTWFLGRLQTERDKARVLDGLEGAAATAGSAFDRARWSRRWPALGNRVFLMNNVHEDQPVVFETRWALSYLRGPLGRQEIKRLMDAKKSERFARQPTTRCQSGCCARQSARGASQSACCACQISPRRPPTSGAAPVLPPGVDAVLPARARRRAGRRAARLLADAARRRRRCASPTRRRRSTRRRR